jgi:hypothetical protein
MAGALCAQTQTVRWSAKLVMMASNDWRSRAFVPTQPGLMTEEEASVARSDQRKAVYEFLRHIGTLDSAALVLIATLIEKVFAQPLHRGLVGGAVMAFLLSLFSGGVSYVVLLAHHPRVGALRISSLDANVAAIGLSTTLAAFLAGMLCVAGFFAFNWFR